MFKIVKLLLVVVLLGVVAYGGFYVAANRGLIPAAQAAVVNNAISSVLKGIKLDTLANQALKSAPSVISNVQNTPQVSSAMEQTSSVLGSSVELETQNPPLPQRAFEQARYTYCQAVVEDYQARYPESKPAPN